MAEPVRIRWQHLKDGRTRLTMMTDQLGTEGAETELKDEHGWIVVSLAGIERGFAWETYRAHAREIARALGRHNGRKNVVDIETADEGVMV